ncbi:MAG TPA: thiamine-phosphate kinase [Bacteroidales bacterium]|nr:MAG: thiamine-phosphate kinase [Bacteroidetes bacterium GWF2_33_38]OFY74439.1 MAG: thiamine-phosphate kinase [Bacteroidetes bacterium RIFOXYA12_FULL_33_9]OFY92047.1 MAG: thiamine-phosphate kinase [Bacteroidetes bacterium RIFOXYA2_FULL_33_7]HBF89098.1 thiamine-phosphate kinase [Bacteroidales bacterium]
MENTKNNATKLSELGEFGLIDYLTKNIKLRHKQTIKGVGDDAAILKFGTKNIVVTTDLLTEGVHFDLIYFPLKHLGYKAVVVNLSDIYAMNASPKQITVSIAISSKFSLEAVDQLYQGIYLACEKYNIDLIGGDTTSSLTGLTISITAIGEIEKEKITYRNGAKENNVICVSGDLGSAYLGLQLLEREKMVFKTNPNAKPKFDGYDYILERQLKPEARKDIIEFLAINHIVPTAMIDVSDGLSSELLHICKQSDVGCKIFEDKIPFSPIAKDMAAELNIDPTVCALNGGEDYELLFTISLDDYNKIKNDPNITPIGHITEKSLGLNLIARDGTEVPLKAQGWNSFNNEK